MFLVLGGVPRGSLPCTGRGHAEKSVGRFDGWLSLRAVSTTMWRTDTLWLEVAVVLGIFAVGNIVFGHFEQHKHPARRLAKVAVVLAITIALSSTVGRAWGLGWLLLPLGAAVYVHLYWLPRHGVNGWTGEPRDRYLALLAARGRGKETAP